ncbi:MAG TPA: Crp/Fnr family transcriptional regulator [Cytophagales bacterium]|nr:Crp/Fnr family transcriptional regulator [Cytophagales bacterium]HAA18068.1 Crp/Fnr family transcriptional regulator [Cytophagales bacterium]HAP62382.1 Crp/Fnr family transcriptional regulator [Cytophagales bacterium]
MIERLQENLLQTLPFTEEELAMILPAFEERTLARKTMLLRDGEVARHLYFLVQGSIRHYLTIDGVEKTCFVSLPGQWFTVLGSFTSGTPSDNYLQALETSVVYAIEKGALHDLYARCPKLESFSRIIMERTTKMIIQLSSLLSAHKPEVRYANLLREQPEYFQSVSQKYIASMLGIQPESLSRIRKRMATQKG